ncbi:MAG: hypothetical protein WDO69_16455 [Pseudomonadota bacterium]
MSRTRPFQSLLLIALAATPALAACSSSDDSRAHVDPISTAGIEREGDASNAQLSTFLHLKPVEWAWAGGQFDTPDDKSTLAADTPVTFTWHADPADFAEGGASGDVVMTHLLQFSSASNGNLLQVFTTLKQYTPDAEDWQKLVDAGEPITLALTTGSFLGTDLPADGGPFIGQTLTFTIE